MEYFSEQLHIIDKFEQWGHYLWVDSQVIKHFNVWLLFCDTEVKSKNMLARQACCTVQVVYYFLDVLLPSQTDFQWLFWSYTKRFLFLW